MRLAKPLASCLLLVVFLLFLNACSPERSPVVIRFAAAWNGQILSCNSTDPALTDLRFYVSNVILIDSQHIEHELQLNPDQRWQQENVALIDLENGEGACMNGTPEMHALLSGTAETQEFEAVRFTIGVPFDLNHANPLLASGPLDDAAMHWHWRSGYKFLRAGIATPSDAFWFHLGSTGCVGTVQNISECRFPNRVTVTVNDLSSDTNEVVVVLSELFGDIDLEDQTPSDCSSGPSEAACTGPFDALGLAFADQRGAPMPRFVFQAGR